MNKIKEFEAERKENIKKIGRNKKLRSLGLKFLVESSKYKYSYNFSWLGRPIIQFPQDMVALQEIIWNVKPDLIIETGIAHGGSLIFYASILEMIGKGEILGIDIDIRKHNRKEIEKHKMFKRIKMIEGSSIDSEIIKKVAALAKKHKKIMVCLDSNHTYDHVAKELAAYSKFVSKNSYLIVYDTVVEDMPVNSFSNRLWGKGNNPKTAAREFLKKNNNFMVDKEIENKLLISVAPEGFLKRIK